MVVVVLEKLAHCCQLFFLQLLIVVQAFFNLVVEDRMRGSAPPKFDLSGCCSFLAENRSAQNWQQFLAPAVCLGLPLDSVFNLGRIWLGTSSRSASRLLLAPAIYIPSTFLIRGESWILLARNTSLLVRVPCPRIALGFVLGSTVLTGQTNKEEVFAEIDADCSKIGGSSTTLDTGN